MFKFEVTNLFEQSRGCNRSDVDFCSARFDKFEEFFQNSSLDDVIVHS